MQKLSHILLLLIALLFFAPISQGQNLRTFDPSQNTPPKPKKSKQKLATEYYVSGDYAKAIVLFEELYKENNSGYFYKYLLYCYLELEEFNKAERLVKKANKGNAKTYKELSDLGYIQLKKGNNKKADELFQKAILKLPANRGAINELARDFRSRGQTDLAKKTYFKGKEMLAGEYRFESELAYLYYYLEQYDNMTDEYLNLLETQPKQMKTIQYRIQNTFRRDKDDSVYPYLKKELLKRIKKDSDNQQFRELLLWLTIQRKDFEIALIQAKSLDKRGGYDAYRVFDLSKLILSHGEYDLSIDAFNYLIDLPNAKDQIYYTEAKQALLSAQFQQFQQLNVPAKNDIDNLQDIFETTLNEVGRNRYSIFSIMDYASFLSFYRDMPDEAIFELEDLIENKGLNNREKAPVKLLLADIYLLYDNPWDATLLYSQVEKDFKNDEIGFDARLKNARLSFYVGEFGWAKAQLDVIKASTGKKIANDAMQLSLFISENLDADSNTRALELYGKAELLHLRMKDSLAFQTFDSIFMLGLYHEIFDDVWLREAQMYIESYKYEKAKTLLEKIANEYTYGLLADDAIWLLAEIELEQFNNTEKASEWYKLILTEYPSSMYSQEARDKYRALRGDVLEEDDDL